MRQITCEKCEKSTGRLPGWDEALQNGTLRQILEAVTIEDLLLIEEHVEKHAVPASMLEQLAQANRKAATATGIV